MTTALQDLYGPGDDALIAAVRDGDGDAYGLLFERHVGAARRLAGQLLPGPDADDLVSEAFAKVLVVLQRGGGPDLAFRAYLLTAIRRLHVDRVRVNARVRPTDDLTPFDPGVPFRDSAVEGFESAAAARAFASLPERWQLVLWHTEVEEQKPAEVAVLLGISANSVSALAYRAREGLRQAFLAMHVSPGKQGAESDCTHTRSQLGSHVRGGMSRRDTRRVEAHLETCRPCAAIHLELMEVNDHLAGLLAPALLGGAAAAYVSTGTGVLGTAGIVLALLDRAKDVVVAHTVGSSVAGAAATAVIGGAVVVAVPPAAAPPSAVAPTPTEARGAAPESAREPAPQPPPLDTTPDRSTSQATPERAPEAASPGPRPSTSPTPGATLEPPAESPSEPAAPSPAPTGPTTPETSTDVEPVAIDLALATEVEESADGMTTIRVTVSGLPEGRSATLTSRGEGVVSGQAPDLRCEVDESVIGSCVVTADPAPYVFEVTASEAGSVTFAVALDGEGTDADLIDNTVRVAVS